MKPVAKLGDAYAEVIPLLRRMGTRFSIEADDIAQEAWIRALVAGNRGNVVSEPARYLIKIARNLFIDAKRASARSMDAMEKTALMAAVAGPQADPERILSGKQDLAIALSTIAELPPRCRQAFELHRFEGLSYAVIARRMGVSASMVEKHIAEAMRRLARALIEADTPAGSASNG